MWLVYAHHIHVTVQLYWSFVVLPVMFTLSALCTACHPFQYQSRTVDIGPVSIIIHTLGGLGTTWYHAQPAQGMLLQPLNSPS